MISDGRRSDQSTSVGISLFSLLSTIGKSLRATGERLGWNLGFLLANLTLVPSAVLTLDIFDPETRFHFGRVCHGIPNLDHLSPSMLGDKYGPKVEWGI